MKFKFVICFFMILVCIISLSFVSAYDSDVNDTNVNLDESISSEEALSISNENSDDLSDSSLTFSNLASSIASIGEGNTLNLENNYTYVNSSDNKYVDGIGISKSITINGNGNIIDGNFESTIFDISSSNLVLKNIIFKNGAYSVGAALYIRSNAHVDIINCTFEYNVANYGIVHLAKGAYANISNSTFKGNVVNNYGVIYSQNNTNFCVYNSVFRENSVNYGVVYIATGTFANISNSTFKGNVVNNYGVIYSQSNTSFSVSNSVFRENSVDMGVIMVYNQTTCNISSSHFLNNTARAGVIYMNKGSKGNIYDCKFENHNVTNGVIYLADNFKGNIYSCNFTDNYANFGVVYVSKNGFSDISDCIFKNNIVKYYGVIYSQDYSYFNVSKSTFINNSVYSGVIRVSNQTNCNIYSSIFENNTADYGVVYLVGGSNANIYDCNFTYNYADYGIIYRGSDSYSDIKNCIFSYNIADHAIIYSPTRSNGNMELCTFQYNFANNYVIYRGGNSKGNLTQCVFDGNVAYGNIIWWFNPDENYIIACEFYSNQIAGNGIVNFYGGYGILYYSYFENNYAYDGIVYSDIGGIYIYGCEFYDNVVMDRGIIFVSDASFCYVGYDSVFYNNTAKYGIIYLSPNSQALIADTDFIYNTAFNGPAIFSLNAEVNINNTYFANNTATFSGGSIYFMYGDLLLNNSYFLNNTAVDGGAICGDSYNSFIIENTNFVNNTASRYGEAIAVLFQSDIMNSNSYFENNDIHFISISEILKITSNAFSFVNIAQTDITSLPSYYNLVDYGYVTSIKDQGADGNCWSFAAMAALESALLKNFNIYFDLSENNLKNLAAYFSDYGSNVMTNGGGYPSMILNYFSSWLGPVNETDDEYFDDNGLYSNLLPSIMHIQNIMYVPRDNISDLNPIKESLMKYGAVAISIHWNNTYINGASVYCNNNLTLNHAVTIVGWNDTYSKNNFIITPPGDGAWIIKNSWGDDSGDNGYYYVSYYDITCALSETNKNYVFIFNSTVNYDNIYQYEFGKKTAFTLNSVVNDTIWGKNVFTAEHDEYIAGVSSMFDVDTDYEVSIYVNRNGVDELIITQNGTALAGYHTIELNKFVSVKKGEVFSVVIKYIGNKYVPSFSNGLSNRNFVQTNVSYVSSNGISYFDASQWGYIVCIKAFTVTKINSTVTLLSINPVEVENSFNIVANVLDQYGNTVNGGNVTFNINGTVYVLNVTDGVANITLNMTKSGLFNVSCIFDAPNYYKSNTSLTFTAFKHKSDLTINVEDVDYNDGLMVNVMVSSGASGYITIKIDSDHTQDVLINNSKASYTFTGLCAGNYTVQAIYDGDLLFNSSYKNASFKVNKISSNIKILDISDVNYGETLIIPFTVTDGASGDVLVSIYKNDVLIANKSVDVNLNSASFSNLNVSGYCVVVKYFGDNNYFTSNSSKIFNINKATSSISVNSFNNVSYSEDISFSFVLVNGTNITYQLNTGNVIDFNVVGNSLKFSNLSAGDYTLFVKNNGDNNHNSSNITFKFSVYKINSDLAINPILLATYPENITISYTISPKTKSDVKISIYRGNVLIANKTVLSTQNNVIFTNLASGNYKVSVEYLDNINFTNTIVNKTFTINKGESDVLISQFENITYGDNLTITSTLINGYTGSFEIIYNNAVNKSGLYSNELIFNNLDAGNYTLIIYNDGDSNHNASNKSVNFTVKKLTPVLSINDISDVVYGNNVSISFNFNTNVNVSIYKNHALISTKTVSGSEAVFDNLGVGNYNVYIKIMGDKNRYEVSDSSSFTIIKANSSIDVNSIRNITFGENLTVNLKFINGSGSYELMYGSESIKSGSEKSFNLTNLESGNYTLNVYNDGDLNHTESSKSIRFNVFKANPNLIINDILDIIYGQNVSISYVSNVDGKFNITVYNSNFSESKVTGGLSATFNLNAGEYYVNVTYLGDINHNNIANTSQFNVIKANSSINVDGIKNITFGENLTVNIDFVNGSGSYELMYGSESIKSGSEKSFDLNDLESGNYILNISNNGDSNHNESFKTVNFSIFKANSTLTINDISSIVYGVNVSISYVSDVSGKFNITVYNTTFKVSKVVNELYATFNLNAGEYYVNVTYLGDKNHNNITNTSQFKVIKANSTISIIGIENITFGENLTVNIDFVNGSGSYELMYGSESIKSGSEKSFNLTNLESGNYTLNVYNDGDLNHNESFKTIKFNVFKANPNLTINDITSVVYGENVTISYVSNVEGDFNVTVYKSGFTVSKVINTLYTSFNLDAGDYNVNVTYLGDNNYNIITKSSTFRVIKASSSVNVGEIKDITFGDNLTVNYTLINGLNGKYELIFNDGVIDTDNSLNVVFKNLQTGNYTLKIYNDGDDNHNASILTSTFKVLKATPDLNVKNINNVVYGNNITVEYEINQSGIINISIYKNNEIVKTSLESNSFKLDAGSYTAQVTYLGNQNYTSISKNLTFTVFNATSDILLNPFSNITYGSEIIFNAKLINSTLGRYELILNGAIIKYNDGIDEIIFSNLNASNYTLKLYNLGDKNHNSSNISVNFTVDKADANIILEEINNVVYGENITISANLDVIVEFYKNDEYLRNVTLNSPSKFLLDAGEYKINVTYLGDENHKKSNISSQFNVIKAKSNINIVPIDDITYGGSVTLNATLECGNGYYRLFRGETLVKSNTTLLETFNNLACGNYMVIVFNNGDENHNKSNLSATFNVKKATPQISIIPKNFTVDRMVGFEISGNNNLTLTMSIYKNNILITNKTVTGDNAVFDKLNAGNYSVFLNFGGNENYTSFNTSSLFKVSKLASSVNITSGESEIIIKVFDSENNLISNVNVTYEIDGINTTNNTGSLGFISLSVSGSGEIKVYFNGDDTYLASVDSYKYDFTKVEAIESKLIITNESDVIVVSLIDVDGNPIKGAVVNYSVGDVKGFNITGADGLIRISGFTGEFTVNVTYVGNESYSGVNASKSFNFKTSRVATNISLSSSQKGIVVIKVVDDKNNPISNIEVKYSINGVNSTNKTGSDGIFAVQLTGEGEIKAFIEDSDLYIKSNDSYKYNFTQSPDTGNNTGETSSNTTTNSTTITPIVSQPATKVNKVASKITAKKATFKAKTKTKKYKITLKADKAIGKAKVTIKIHGKTYKAKTNSKGKATFKITKLTKKGKYIAVIKYAGNSKYKSSSKKVKIAVK